MREFDIDARNYTDLINKYFDKKKKICKKWKRYRHELHLKIEYKEKIFNFLKKENEQH
jgi:hypothetical protein